MTAYINFIGVTGIATAPIDDFSCSVSTNFRLELIAPSARKVLIFCNLSKRAAASGERRNEHGANLARLETASGLKYVDP